MTVTAKSHHTGGQEDKDRKTTTASPPTSTAHSASATDHQPASGEGGRGLSQLTEQVVTVLRQTTLEVKHAAVEQVVRDFPGADHLAAARTVVDLWDAGQTRAPMAPPILKAVLVQQVAKPKRETEAEAQARRHTELQTDVRWCEANVPDLPAPYAVTSLQLLRIGNSDVTAEQVRSRVLAKHHWLEDE